MRSFITWIALVLMVGTVLADDRQPPASWSLDRPADVDIAAIDRTTYGPLDVDALAAEDADREAMGQPPRFAYGHPTRYLPAARGTWDELGDTSIWRFRVSAQAAVLLNFGFEDFHLPDGALLWIYHPRAAHARSMDRHLVIGPYDASKNRDHGEFWTPNLIGDEAIIEINVPTESRDQLSLTISQVSQGYRGFGQAALGYRQTTERSDGEGKQSCEGTAGTRSGACNQDVACLSEDDPWNDPVRSVGAYQRSGSFACTGSLVNNTANDQRMLFMTATHCIGQGQAPSIVVYWNYEWPTCRRPGASGGTDTNPPDPNMSQSGGTLLAATSNPFGGNCTAPDECSDVTLIELDDAADPELELHWSGWDRRPPPTICAQGPDNATEGLCATIHHPGVDEKRITWVADDIQVGNISGASGIHWHPFWHPEPPELPNMPPPPPTTIPPAVTEPGSSGSPLYTADRRFIGVLSGGPAFCGATGSQLSDFYGGLWHAWDGMGSPTTRMRDYLDPLGTNPEFIDGIDGEGFDIEPETTTPGQCGFGDYDLAIDIEPRGEFDEPVTLAATGLPAGVGASFSVNPVTPPGSTLLTLTDLDQAGNGSFEFSIEGEADDQTEAVSITFTQFDEQPDPVTLLSPADGVEDIGLNPTLTWSADILATDFVVEVATDDAFANVVFTTETQAQSQQVEVELDTGTVYYWRVQSANLCGDSWSETWSFTTRLEPEAQFSATEFSFEVQEDDLESVTLEIANIGTGNLTWAIVTDLPDGLRSGHDAELDETLAIPDFAIDSAANGGQPFEHGTPAGQATRGQVVGFSFEGTVSGISGNSSWASDMCLIVEAPDGSTYAVGGFSGSVSGCDVNNWDFDGGGSTDNGTYDSTHIGVFDEVDDQGEWTFTFINDWNSASAATMSWTDVTITLHKAPLPVCGDELTNVDWLSVDPDSGVVAEGEAQNVSVMVNTFGLDVGEYVGYLCVETNAPNAELVPMPVELEVTERLLDPPVIGIDPTALSVTVDEDGSDSAGFEISNSGEDNLTWFVDTAPAGCELPGWASLDPNSGSVAEGDVESVTVHFDAAGLEAGEYSATACIASNDPNSPRVDVELEMTVTATTALIEGTVTGLGYCQDDPAPLANAFVNINGQTTTTDADGSYAVAVDAESAPVIVAFTHPDHRGQSEEVAELEVGQTVTVDADLVLRAACATVDPEALSFSLTAEATAEQTLTVSNALGGSDMQWSLDTSEGCFDVAEIDWLSVSNTGGVIGWGNVREVTVSADAGGLSHGSHETTLCLVTDDDQNESIEVPVVLDVVEPLIFEDRFEATE
jgi:lysyl endopeptidase